MIFHYDSPGFTASYCFYSVIEASTNEVQYLPTLCNQLNIIDGHNRRWIDTDTIDRYYRSCWLPIASIYRLKIFHFLTDGIDHRSEKKNFSSIKSNHWLKIFFSTEDHRSNRCFLQLIDYRYRSNRCFFSPSVPIYAQHVTKKQKKLFKIQFSLGIGLLHGTQGHGGVLWKNG